MGHWSERPQPRHETRRQENAAPGRGVPPRVGAATEPGVRVTWREHASDLSRTVVSAPRHSESGPEAGRLSHGEAGACSSVSNTRVVGPTGGCSWWPGSVSSRSRWEVTQVQALLLLRPPRPGGPQAAPHGHSGLFCGEDSLMALSSAPWLSRGPCGKGAAGGGEPTTAGSGQRRQPRERWPVPALGSALLSPGRAPGTAASAASARSLMWVGFPHSAMNE